jgi:hypothetical protein
MSKIQLIIILFSLFYQSKARDTIWFSDVYEAQAFMDSVNIPNDYPRQDAITWQLPRYDSSESRWFSEIEKVSEKGLSQSDSSWMPFMEANIGDTLWYNSNAYRVIQRHYTASHWTPDIAISLFVEISMEECSEWVQPVGAQDAYNIGDCVTIGAYKYISNINANTTDPELFNDEDSPWDYWDKEPFDE